MVEADSNEEQVTQRLYSIENRNPSGVDFERIPKVEKQIFDSVDEEIEEFNIWCKVVFEEMTQKIEALAKRHRQIAKIYRDQISQNKKDFPEMFQKQQTAEIEQRLNSILQTEERRERFFIGTEADYRNESGQLCLSKILTSLTESEQAVQNRWQKLNNLSKEADL